MMFGFMAVLLFSGCTIFVTSETENSRMMMYKVNKGVHMQQKDMLMRNASSRIHCSMYCVNDPCCVSANFNQVNHSCHLLRYPEIPYQRRADTSWDLLTPACDDEDESVSNCLNFPEREGMANFLTVLGYILKGYDDRIQSGISLDECRQYCLEMDEFHCRSFDYIQSTWLCRVSRFTKDDPMMRLESNDEEARYEQRLC